MHATSVTDQDLAFVEDAWTEGTFQRMVSSGGVLFAERADVGEALLGARREGMQLDTDTADKVFLPGMHTSSLAPSTSHGLRNESERWS